MQGPTSDLPITELELSTRAKNALLNADISTVGNALSALGQGDETLTKIKGFGSKSLADLKKQLEEQGFALPQSGGIVTPLQVLEDTLERELQELRALEVDAPPVAVAAAPEARPPDPVSVLVGEPAPEPVPVVVEEPAPEPVPVVKT